MPASGEITRVELVKLTIPENRQRKEIKDIEGLAESIRRLGLLHPIIITRDFTLVAGERRLRAWTSIHESELILGISVWSTIPCHFIDQLDQVELRVVELEENIKRQDITWQEQAKAVAEIHALMVSNNPVWSQTATAARIGLHNAQVSKHVLIMKESVATPKVLTAPTMNSALATIKRTQDRKAQDIENAVSDLARGGLEKELAEAIQDEFSFSGGSTTDFTIGVETVPASQSILTGDAIKFMATHSGERFNLIHCDFPYGIDYDGWDGSAEHIGGYEDSPEVYRELLKALANFWDNIAAPSSHLLFWFSMKYYDETMRFFNDKIPALTIDEFPLIWLKSDNKGSVPDPNRGPRRVYETALFGYTGDRRIVKPVANGYAAPTNRTQSIHISEKPEPVLRHFLSMVTDENTTCFDPTCGSGSSLRAAESLGAKRVLGIEKDEGYANAARKKLDEFRTIRSLV